MDLLGLSQDSALPQEANQEEDAAAHEILTVMSLVSFQIMGQTYSGMWLSSSPKKNGNGWHPLRGICTET